MANIYHHRYTVVGTYPFPLDMLRYDGAYPATEEDARKMTAAVAGDSLEAVKTKYSIELVAPKHTAHWVPRRARWESFLWNVNGEVLVDNRR